MQRNQLIRRISIVVPLVLHLSPGTLWPGEPATDIPNPPPRAKLVEPWLDRAEKFANSVPQTERYKLVGILGSALAEDGQLWRAQAILDKIEGQKQKSVATEDLIIALAQLGKIDDANRLAFALNDAPVLDTATKRKTASIRDVAFFMIVSTQVAGGDFDGATVTLKRIVSPDLTAKAWYSIAEGQAESGQYDNADSSAAQIKLGYAVDQNSLEKLRQTVADCRRTSRRNPLQKNPCEYFQRLRQMASLFTNMNLPRDLKAAEDDVRGMKSPADQSAAWRQIAWGYYGKADRPGAERAIRESLAMTETPTSPASKVDAYLSAADLYLEMRDPKRADEVAKKALAVGLNSESLGGLNAFSTAPFVVAVLARTGHFSEVIETIEKLGNDGDAAWEALATVCGLNDTSDVIEHLLSKDYDNRVKAILCAGVAAGIQEKMRQKERELKKGQP